MPYYCTVPRCTSMAGKAKNVSFHQFPRDEELAKLWNKILKRGKPYTKYSKVCSLHFTPEDYTITSVGKNKGQWRTLRKDAIPSQNLPSESPTPYQRKQWVSWAREPQANLIDPAIHQRVAQAIYMQTMLAMQAAGAPEVPLHHDNGIPPAPSEAFAHTSTTPDTDILKGKQTNTHQSTSYKCTECSKYFKDPDVFILHKRSHIKNEKTEKENFNLNLTLQANPILANLLKNNTENANIFDNNFSVENFLMTALAANMEGYMRNFTSLIKAEHQNGHVDPDQNDSQLDDDHSDHNNRQLDHDRGDDNNREVDQEYSDQETGQNDQERSRDEHVNDTDQSGHKNQDMEDDDHNENDERGFQDCQSTSQSVLDYSNSLYNNNRVKKTNENNMNHNGDNVIHDGHMKNDNDLMNRDTNLFHNKTMDIHKNYDSNRIIRYYENNDSGSSSGERSVMDHDHGKINSDPIKNDKSMKTDHMWDHMWDREREMLDHAIDTLDHGRGVTYENDSQGSSDEPICDKDYNESVDSNKLVIDETF